MASLEISVHAGQSRVDHLGDQLERDIQLLQFDVDLDQLLQAAIAQG